MDKIGWFVTGGFAKGYRTYILTGLAAVTVAAHWVVGDQTTQETARALWEILMAGSVAAIRAVRD